MKKVLQISFFEAPHHDSNLTGTMRTIQLIKEKNAFVGPLVQTID
jgi:hypothetical protein